VYAGDDGKSIHTITFPHALAIIQTQEMQPYSATQTISEVITACHVWKPRDGVGLISQHSSSAPRYKVQTVYKNMD